LARAGNGGGVDGSGLATWLWASGLEAGL